MVVLLDVRANALALIVWAVVRDAFARTLASGGTSVDRRRGTLRGLRSRRQEPASDHAAPGRVQADRSAWSRSLRRQWDALYALSGMKTMPQIFHGDDLVGGFQQLAELDRQNQLSSLK